MKKSISLSNGHPPQLLTSKATEHSNLFSLDEFYYKEISEFTEAGAWSVNFIEKRSFFDKQARKILKVPEVYRVY